MLVKSSIDISITPSSFGHSSQDQFAPEEVEQAHQDIFSTISPYLYKNFKFTNPYLPCPNDLMIESLKNIFFSHAGSKKQEQVSLIACQRLLVLILHLQKNKYQPIPFRDFCNSLKLIKPHRDYYRQVIQKKNINEISMSTRKGIQHIKLNYSYLNYLDTLLNDKSNYSFLHPTYRK